MNKIKLTGFLSYAHKDSIYCELFLEGLRSQLKHSESLDLDIWDDSQIPLGEDWKKTITDQIEKSDFAILLVSAYFLSSNFIEKEEFLRFVRFQNEKGFKFYTVVVSACNISQWESLHKNQFFFAKGKDYNLPKQEIMYYGDLVNFDKDGVVSPNAYREKFHNDFARTLEQSLLSNFSKSNKTKTIELKTANAEPVASVNAIRKFHGKKNLEEYISIFEEATGFEDFVVKFFS